MERGIYRNPDRGRQLLLFDGMQYGNITPSDLDGYIEYKDKGWVWVEAKVAGAEVPIGQRLAMERFCNDMGMAHKHAIAMVVEHSTEPWEDVHLRDCIVRELYWNGERRWRKPYRRITAKQATDSFLQKLAKDD